MEEVLGHALPVAPLRVEAQDKFFPVRFVSPAARARPGGGLHLVLAHASGFSRHSLITGASVA